MRKSATSARLTLPGKLVRLLDEHAAARPRSSSSRATRPAARPSRAATATRQAILPLRGKVLNAENASMAKVLENKELADLVTALGCGIGKAFDLTRLRYGKVIILADADSDGHHIATLLLTFIYRHMPQLIEHRPRLPGAAAALPHRHRQGDLLGPRRGAEGGHPGRQDRPGQARDHPLQGPGRDDAEGAVGDDAEPEDPAAAAGRGRPTRWSTDRDHQRADGQGRLGPLPLHHGARRGRRRSWTSEPARADIVSADRARLSRRPADMFTGLSSSARSSAVPGSAGRGSAGFRGTIARSA